MFVFGSLPASRHICGKIGDYENGGNERWGKEEKRMWGLDVEDDE